jgi:hypothetical protein
MCTLRALFVISEGGDIVLSRYVLILETSSKSDLQVATLHRIFNLLISSFCHNSRYGSVEKLAKQIYGEQYVAVAPDWEFKQLFLDEFAKVATTREPNLNAFDAIRSQALLTLQEKLWPVVYMNTVRFSLDTSSNTCE